VVDLTSGFDRFINTTIMRSSSLSAHRADKNLGDEIVDLKMNKDELREE